MAAPSFLDRSEVSSLLKKAPAAVIPSAAIEDSGLAGKNPSAKKPGKREIPRRFAPRYDGLKEFFNKLLDAGQGSQQHK